MNYKPATILSVHGILQARILEFSEQLTFHIITDVFLVIKTLKICSFKQLSNTVLLTVVTIFSPEPNKEKHQREVCQCWDIMSRDGRQFIYHD